MKENIPKNNIFSETSTDLTSCINKVVRLTNCIEISNLINSELSIGRLLTNVMETTKKVFLADSVSLLLKDEKTSELTFQIALGDVGNKVKEIFRLKKGEGIAGVVAKTGEPLNLKNVYDHPGFCSDYDKKTGYKTKAMLCVPLKARGSTLGVIQVMNKICHPFYFTDEELEMLVTIGSSAAVAIDRAKMHEIILQRETLERDLHLANEVQQSFLPMSLPEIDGYSFAALNQPALEVGGDFYNFFRLPNERLGIVLGDVSGKGISASLFMARLTSDLQYYALLHETPSRLLGEINDLLCVRAKSGMFVTLIYILLDLPRKQIQFSNAGHLFPIYGYQNNTRLLGSYETKGVPLGIIPGITYEQETFDLESGSSITVCTDGITEAKNSSGKLYGMERLLLEIQKQPPGPEQLIQNITASVHQFAQGQSKPDDITLLSVWVD